MPKTKTKTKRKPKSVTYTINHSMGGPSRHRKTKNKDGSTTYQSLDTPCGVIVRTPRQKRR